ncbi:50S ribosomal protein L15 [Archaeoglobales archaeon]|mgnify:CR=1 FL=1|nr:MAG: 50S ribosomal protein L15 [Archaeoglobales archaeon]
MKKKVKKIRGTRTCGGGSHKKRRGKGSRGGAGNAGVTKHHYLRTIKLIKAGLYQIGKYGFTRPKIVRKDYRIAREVRDTLKELKREGKIDDYTYKFLYSRVELNVGDLDEIIDKLVELGLAEKKDEKYSVDLTQFGYSKLLGRGNITKAIDVRIFEATKKAVEKIEKVGGSIIFE